MKFDVLTLFPDMFECLNQSIIGRAKEKELIDINLINIRDFSNNKHKKVDDTPYFHHNHTMLPLYNME